MTNEAKYERDPGTCTPWALGTSGTRVVNTRCTAFAIGVCPLLVTAIVCIPRWPARITPSIVRVTPPETETPMIASQG